MSTVVKLPPRGRWVWDARGHDRAVRVSAHAPEGVVNLSVWRDEICVGTVRLQPDEVVGLVEGLTEGLARLAERPSESPSSLGELEDRLARIEARLARPVWRTAAASAVARAGAALGRVDALRKVPGQGQ